MNCEECNDLVYDYLDGSLSPEDARSFEQALDRCDHCAEQLAQAKNIRSALQVRSTERPLGAERRTVIIAAAQAKADEFKGSQTNSRVVIPFPRRIARWMLAAAAVLAGVIGYWVLQVSWEQPSFTRGSESESVARVDQMPESESESESEPESEPATRGARSPGSETSEGAGSGRGPTEATEPANVEAGEPVVAREQAQAGAAFDELIEAEIVAERSVDRGATEMTAEDDELSAAAPSRRAAPVDRDADREDARRVAPNQASRGSSATAGAEQRSGLQVRARAEQASTSSPAPRPQTPGEIAGLAGESMDDAAPIEGGSAQFGSGSASGGAVGRSSAERRPNRVADDRGLQAEAAPVGEPQSSVRQELNRMRGQTEAGSPGETLSIGRRLSRRENLTASERAELYFLMGTAEESRGNRDSAAEYYQRAVDQGIGTSYGRTSYQRLQTISR